MYGNGWTTGDIYGVPWGNDNAYVEWETLVGGVVVSSGTIGPDPILHLATIIGFSDPDGFDQLRLKCRIANSLPADWQAVALDDLKVQLSPVPEPTSLAALGLGALILLRRRSLPVVR